MAKRKFIEIRAAKLTTAKNIRTAKVVHADESSINLREKVLEPFLTILGEKHLFSLQYTPFGNSRGRRSVLIWKWIN